MFRRLKAALRRTEAEKLTAVLDAQRAEQRNAESRLQRLREIRDALMARGSEEARTRLDALDREIATVAQRATRALQLQTELMVRLGQAEAAVLSR